MKLHHVLLFVAVALMGASSQAADAKKLIVKLKEGQDVSQLQAMGYQKIEVLVQDLGIYSVEVPAAMAMRSSLKGLQNELRSQSGIVYAQEDHVVTYRSKKATKSWGWLWDLQPDQQQQSQQQFQQPQKQNENLAPLTAQQIKALGWPDDVKFSTQWDFTTAKDVFGIDAVGAWKQFGTGGKDARGSDIVVAVVDGGVDTKHQDLTANIWVNSGEIAGNNIDDDGNGYVDDVNGWNAYSNNGKVPVDTHGTHVAGTVGATGNNKIFGAGINWNVKIMPIGGASGSTSIVLKAYGYVLAQKKLWLESNGQKGANIVVTNSSFGVDYGDCKSSNYAAWNDIYNEMGKVGIISSAATINGDVDVDKQGDVPTGCDSEYLITVTNTEKNGERSSDAGHGQTTIDLAAPGTDIFSTIPNNRWTSMSGTSMSTPHVAGAVAYLHSVASKKFNDGYYADPAQAALELKHAILSSVTPVATLKTETVSGGILNLNSAAAVMSNY